MILNEFYTLNNGVRIPKLGLGTWCIDDDKAAAAIKEAVKLGYRHFDTAEGYGNERGIGEGIRTSGIKREDLFVTTKLDASIKNYDKAKKAIQSSLDKMKLDYIDMMIIHSPQPWTNFRENNRYFEGNIEAWKALEEFYKQGKLRAIGVSNFEKEDLDNILNNCNIKPAVNQILVHISNSPLDLIEYTQKQGILVEAYSPVAHGELLKNKEVSKIAGKYGVTIAQLSIRYCLQLGTLPLPKTTNPNHMKNNADVNFEITKDDIEILKRVETIKNYGEYGIFPVYGGKMTEDGTCIARDWKN